MDVDGTSITDSVVEIGAYGTNNRCIMILNVEASNHRKEGYAVTYCIIYTGASEHLPSFEVLIFVNNSIIEPSEYN